ncbi:MAG: AAA domain-containing protein [Candidatus Thermoplasmatota archaeon]
MKKHMSAHDFLSLLSYYIECIQQEQLLSIVLPKSKEGKQFVSLPLTYELLSCETAVQVPLSHSGVLEQFLVTNPIKTSHKKLCFSFPVFDDTKENIYPLIMIPLSWEKKGTTFELYPDLKQIEFNFSILFRCGLEIEEINEIRTVFDPTDPYKTVTQILEKFTSSVQSVFHNSVQKQKINVLTKGILFYIEKTNFTHSLLIELQRLKNIPFSKCEDSILNVLINPLENRGPCQINHDDLLEIYPLNPSQEQAVSAALTQPFTVITGPPGTGKSQVVLNIIANAVWSGKKVLFASKNNKAVDVITEKLRPLIRLPVIMRMGAEQHRQQTRIDISDMFQEVPSSILKIDISEITHEFRNIVGKIRCLQEQLNTMIEINKNIDKMQSDINLQLKNVPEYIVSLCYQEIQQNLNNSSFHKLLLKIVQKRTSTGLYKFGNLFSKLFSYKNNILLNELHVYFSRSLQEVIVSKLQNKTIKQEELFEWLRAIYQSILFQNKIDQLNKKLKELPPAENLRRQIFELQQKKIQQSRLLFEYTWISKVHLTGFDDRDALQKFFETGAELQKYIPDLKIWKKLDVQWKRNFVQILPFLPVWITTNLSVKNSIPFHNALFDLVIIDEASQCDIVSAIPLLFRARQAVIIGDPQQLRHISLLTSSFDENLASQHHINSIYNYVSYTQCSLYDLAEKLALFRGQPPILLNEHYRCHRDIITFSNNYFYQQKLAIHTNHDSLITTDYHIHGVLWTDTPGNTIRSYSSYNLEEIDAVIDLLQRLQDKHSGKPVSIGVVTLFRAQMELIEEKLKLLQIKYSMPITVGTAHRFQGDEKDIIIFSPAISTGAYPGTLQWIETTRQLINVAISRAKSLLIIVGDQKMCQQTKGILKELADYVHDVQQETSITFSSSVEEVFYDAARKNGLRLVPKYHVHLSNNHIYTVDFVLFTGNQKYVIWIDKNPRSNIIDTVLRQDDWQVRYYTTSDITKDLVSVIESIKRLC